MPSPSSAPRHVPVSRAHRLLDALSASLVIIGGVLFSFAFAGLARLHRLPGPEYVHGMRIEQLSRYYRLSAMSWAGLAMVVLGVMLGVYTWLQHRAARPVAD